MRKRVLSLMALVLFTIGPGPLCAADPESLTELRKEKLTAAKKWLEEVVGQFGDPKANLEYDQQLRLFYAAAVAVKSAAYEVAGTNEERLAAIKQHAERLEAKFQEVSAAYKVHSRLGTAENFFMVKTWRTEAAIWLKEEQSKVAPR